MALAGLILLPILVRNLRKIPPYKFLPLLAVGTIGNAIPAYLFAEAETEVSSALAGMLNSTTSFFTIIVAVLIFRQKAPWTKWFGISVGLAGAIGLTLSGTAGNIEFNSYAFLVVIATFCYGLSVNIIHHQLADISSITIASVALFMVGFPMGIYLFTTDFTSIVTSHPHGFKSLFYIIILAALGTAVALIYFNKLIKITDGIFASTVTYLIPIVAIFWGLILHESISPWQILFVAITLLGVYITNRSF